MNNVYGKFKSQLKDIVQDLVHYSSSNGSLLTLHVGPSLEGVSTRSTPKSSPVFLFLTFSLPCLMFSLMYFIFFDLLNYLFFSFRSPNFCKFCGRPLYTELR